MIRIDLLIRGNIHHQASVALCLRSNRSGPQDRLVTERAAVEMETPRRAGRVAIGLSAIAKLAGQKLLGQGNLDQGRAPGVGACCACEIDAARTWCVTPEAKSHHRAGRVDPSLKRAHLNSQAHHGIVEAGAPIHSGDALHWRGADVRIGGRVAVCIQFHRKAERSDQSICCCGRGGCLRASGQRRRSVRASWRRVQGGEQWRRFK